MPFNKLEGASKKYKEKTYEDFDAKFTAMLTSLQKAAEKSDNDKW